MCLLGCGTISLFLNVSFFISSWFFLSLGGKQTKKNPELKLNERWMKSTQDESIVVYGQQFDVGIYLLFSCSSFFFSFLPSIMNELDLLSLITISWWIFSIFLCFILSSCVYLVGLRESLWVWCKDCRRIWMLKRKYKQKKEIEINKV